MKFIFTPFDDIEFLFKLIHQMIVLLGDTIGVFQRRPTMGIAFEKVMEHKKEEFRNNHFMTVAQFLVALKQKD